MPQMHDNGGTRVAEQPREIRETLLTVDYARPLTAFEAEDILVRWQPGTDRVEIDDCVGGVIVGSRAEMLAALGVRDWGAGLRDAARAALEQAA
jgi:hypothetical protein